MATRAIDLLIAYRVSKMLVTPFNKQPAYQYGIIDDKGKVCLLYTSPSPRDLSTSRMPSSA